MNIFKNKITVFFSSQSNQQFMSQEFLLNSDFTEDLILFNPLLTITNFEDGVDCSIQKAVPHLLRCWMLAAEAGSILFQCLQGVKMYVDPGSCLALQFKVTT
jgi:hypothetical protein